MNKTTKKILTLTVAMMIIATGFGYQYSYHQRKLQYQTIIAGYYREHFNREPDAIGLHHWVTWALNKWGLEKVERIGFIEARQKGAA